MEVEEVDEGVNGKVNAEDKAGGEGEGVNEGVNEQALVKMIRDTFPASAIAASEGIKELATTQHNL